MFVTYGALLIWDHAVSLRISPPKMFPLLPGAAKAPGSFFVGVNTRAYLNAA